MLRVCYPKARLLTVSLVIPDYVMSQYVYSYTVYVPRWLANCVHHTNLQNTCKLQVLELLMILYNYICYVYNQFIYIYTYLAVHIIMTTHSLCTISHIYTCKEDMDTCIQSGHFLHQLLHTPFLLRLHPCTRFSYAKNMM